MDITLPNGTVIQGVPDGTNKWKVAEIAISRGLAKPEDFGQQSVSPTAPPNPARNEFNPYVGRTGGESRDVLAGYGKAAMDLGRGVGQALGMVSRDDVQKSRDLDAPLMASSAGKAGYVGGMVADTIPAAFIPGANTVAGAGAIGAGLGFLQPSTSTAETATNTGLGGALGAGGVVAARGASALYNGGKALVEPFLKGGQGQIAARTMQAFAGGKGEASRAAQNIDDALLGNYLGVKPFVEGSSPTSAELANNAGLAQLERTLKNNPEFMTRIDDHLKGNRAAILSSIDSVAGSDWQMAGAKSVREARSSNLYDAAKKVRVDTDDTLESLLARPSMQKAWDRAAQLASEGGDVLRTGEDVPEKIVSPWFKNVRELGGSSASERRMASFDSRPEAETVVPAQKSQFSGRALHYLKMAMDDLADNPQASGIGAHEARAIGNTRSSLVEWIGKNIPQYDAARKAYSALSRPINQMEVGQALRNKLQPALADYGATGRTRAAAYAEALRNGDEFAASALGRSNAKLDSVMEPEQMSKLHMIADQLGRRANADELGRAVGSNTGQNIVSQNVLRQFLGPLGLPESTIQRVAESTLLQSVMRPAQFVGRLGEERVMQMLSQAMLDPKVTKEMLRVGIDPRKAGLLLKNQQFIAPALVSGANAARQ